MSVDKLNFSVGVPGMSSQISRKSYRHETLIKKVQAKKFAPELEAEIMKRIRSFPEAALGKFDIHKTIKEATEKVENAKRKEDGDDTTDTTPE